MKLLDKNRSKTILQDVMRLEQLNNLDHLIAKRGWVCVKVKLSSVNITTQRIFYHG